MNKEKILLDIVTKDGSRHALASLIPKIRALVSNFPSTSNHSMVTSGFVTMGSIFSLFTWAILWKECEKQKRENTFDIVT